MHSKDVFWFSLSAMMLGTCCVCVFHIWNHERIRKENVARKASLYEYYASEIYFGWYRAFNQYSSQTDKDSAYKKIKKIRAKMSKDGFDNAEIDKANQAGFGKAHRDTKDTDDFEKKMNHNENERDERVAEGDWVIIDSPSKPTALPAK